MQCGNVWISWTEDCDENKGGYFCQVYADEEMSNEIDYFCVHPEDCDCSDEKEVEKFIQQYSRMYNCMFGKNNVFWEHVQAVQKSHEDYDEDIELDCDGECVGCDRACADRISAE